jgi:hypothetical protein
MLWKHGEGDGCREEHTTTNTHHDFGFDQTKSLGQKVF